MSRNSIKLPPRKRLELDGALEVFSNEEPIEFTSVTNSMRGNPDGEIYYMRMRVERYCPRCKKRGNEGTMEISIHNDTCEMECVFCKFWVKVTQDEGVDMLVTLLRNIGYEIKPARPLKRKK